MDCNKNCFTPYTEFNNNELARASVVDQPFQNILCTQDALVKGTAFADLYKPYMKRKCKKSKKMC